MQSLLKHIKTIHPISAKAEAALIEICHEVKFHKGADVQAIGHTCKTIYFVKEGCVRIYYFKEDIDITESFEFENAFVARAESLFTGKPSLKAIQAIEDTSLIAMDSNKLFLFLLSINIPLSSVALNLPNTFDIKFIQADLPLEPLPQNI